MRALAVNDSRKSLRDRLYDKFLIHPGTRCWIWTGSRRMSGYGELRIRRRYKNPMLATRLSWELHYGTIPHGLCVLHECDNPACINPEHLFLGTVADNNHDKTRKGRQARGARLIARCRIGRERSPNFLKEVDVIFIRAHPELSGVALAARFGVDCSTISRVRTGNTWGHLRAS
jgi:hypothetical protein